MRFLTPSGSASEEEVKNERATREGFLRYRTVWFGGVDDWWRDWWFHVENTHTLVALTRGHALHPFGRFDRACYVGCVLGLNFFSAAYVQYNYSRTRFQHYTAVAAASCLLVAFDRVLRTLATSPCMQVGGSLHCLCACLREFCIDCGRTGLYACLIGSLFCALAGFSLAVKIRMAPGQFLETYVATKTAAWAFEFVPMIYFFYYRREAQREYWAVSAKTGERTLGGAYPLGYEWPRPSFLLERRARGPPREPRVQAWQYSSSTRSDSAEARRRRAGERDAHAQRLDSTSQKHEDRHSARRETRSSAAVGQDHNAQVEMREKGGVPRETSGAPPRRVDGAFDRPNSDFELIPDLESFGSRR